MVGRTTSGIMINDTGCITSIDPSVCYFTVIAKDAKNPPFRMTIAVKGKASWRFVTAHGCDMPADHCPGNSTISYEGEKKYVTLWGLVLYWSPPSSSGSGDWGKYCKVVKIDCPEFLSLSGYCTNWCADDGVWAPYKAATSVYEYELDTPGCP